MFGEMVALQTWIDFSGRFFNNAKSSYFKASKIALSFYNTEKRIFDYLTKSIGFKAFSNPSLLAAAILSKSLS